MSAIEHSEFIVLFITTPTAAEGQRISRALVEQKKVACVNIVPGVSSLFWWQGKIDSAQESLLIVKTKTSLLNEVIGLVKDLHSYQIPEIIALPIIGGNPDYLEWIDRSLTKSSGQID